MNYKHQGKNKIVKNMPAVDNNRESYNVLLQKQNGNVSVLFCSTIILRTENLDRISLLRSGSARRYTST